MEASGEVEASLACVFVRGGYAKLLGDETPPAHSERVYKALLGPKRLVLLPKTGHGVGLSEPTWKIIDEWVAEPKR